MTTTQKNTFEPTTETDESFITTAKRSLAQREDLAGQTYRAIRDNPKTSAAVATGVAAAAAGGAFLWSKSRQTPDEVVEEVKENNAEELSNIQSKSAPAREPQA